MRNIISGIQHQVIGSEKYWLLKVKSYYLEYKRIPIGQYDKENLPRRKIDTKLAKTILKKNKVGGFIPLDFKIYYKVIAFKTTQCGIKIYNHTCMING